MLQSRFDWLEHLREVSGEYAAAREAVDWLRKHLEKAPVLLPPDSEARKHLGKAQENLEGTYIVRLFAAFEAALRSYDRAKHKDPNRITDASILIDQIGGKRGRGIASEIREGAHAVRDVRNYWAHESDQAPGPMSIQEARRRLNRYLAELPEEW